ncbi:MAG: hypothetical protein GY730_00835 [bacterium]|nr:hypothetical protein [bacterium]
MDINLNDVIDVLCNTFQKLENTVSKPQRKKTCQGHTYESKDKTAQEAIIQKLARYITSLQSAKILNEKGFYQEQGALQRMMDEYSEDVLFLAYGIFFNDDGKGIHKDYLNNFFQIGSKNKKPCQGKIREYIDFRESFLENLVEKPNVSLQGERMDASRNLRRAYSGYIHGDSPTIMEMFNGKSFNIYGGDKQGLKKVDEEEILNYYYRGVTIFNAVSTSVFGIDVPSLFRLCSALSRHLGQF